MKWYEALSREDQKEINILSGALDLPEPGEFKDLAAFLHTVSDRICTAGSLVSRATALLNCNVYSRRQ